MIKKQIFVFLLRWIATSIGMYFCITWFGNINQDLASATLSTEAGKLAGAEASNFVLEHGWIIFAVAGLIFSLINSFVKPLIKIFALPLAILTMGISTIIINTAMVILTFYLLPGVEMSFYGAFITSLLMSIINGGLNLIIG